MKRYLLLIEDKDLKTWKTFAVRYKKKHLGRNINEAIIQLIKNNNEGE